MNLSGWLLKRMGWRFVVNTPPVKKCVICVAPHTSNWDFPIGELCIHSVGLKAGFLMKDAWFFFPMGVLMRALGGVPVARGKGKINHVTRNMAHEFSRHETLALAVTPEGTRSRNPQWHKGFLHIAQEAGVPIVLAYIDYATRTAALERVFQPTGDTDADMIAVKEFYRNCGARGKHHENFATGLDERQ